MKRQRLAVLSAACAALLGGEAFALPAFPGAQGFGANAVGGRNGDVFHVDSLADTNTGTGKHGTLRYAISSATGPRTIVFDVGGSIILSSDLSLNKSFITIAGQTAPGPGITLINKTPANNPSSLFYKFQITSSSGLTTESNIVRYLTVRRGVNDINAATDDSVGILGSGTTKNIILDHMSASWATDEDLSPTNNSTNITVQNSYMTESLNPKSHAYGTLVRPQVNSSISFHHNLYADNASRNPRIGNYNGTLLQFDFRNNVVYNWSSRASYTGGASETDTEFSDANYVGNYFIAGPSTPNGTTSSTAFTLQTDADPVYVRMYQANNRIDSNHNAVRDGADTGWGMFVESNAGTHPFPVDSANGKQMSGEFSWTGNDYIVTDTPDDAYAKILASGGGSLPGTKNFVDARIASSMQSSPNSGAIINAPDSTEWNNLYNAAAVSRPANWDSDGDGMPDFWESARGLNPAVDDHTNLGPNGYTNLENYLNELTLAASWNLNANGNWGTISNWIGSVPSVMDSSAHFGPTNTAPRTVTVDGAKTVGGISFDSVQAYTLSGSTITLDVISGRSRIDVVNGSHTISAPLALADDTMITIAPAASTLTVSNLLASTHNITKAGAGTLAVTNMRAGDLALSAGKVKVAANGGAAGVSYLKSLSIDPAADLDLNDNDLVVEYGTRSDSFATIRGYVFNGYSSTVDPSRTGIISSSGQSAGNTILALFDNALVGATDWPLGSGHTIDANSVIGKYTYFGDANLDGQVTADDYGILDANLGSTPPIGIAWLRGDANLDGTVTADDYGILDANFGAGVGSPLAPQAVPEPGTTVGIGFGLLVGARRRRAGRRPSP